MDSYPKANLAESVQNICLKEYDLKVNARLVGATLYASCDLNGLVGKDLGLQHETLEKLEGAMLSTTRVSLSTDAKINFIVVKARDSHLGVTVTLIRYMPDIKGLIYYQMSRDDFGERLIMESENSSEADSPENWADIPVTDFMARLAASRLQRQFTANPLVNVFLQVHRVKGGFQDGTLSFMLDKFESSSDSNVLVDEVLKTAVQDTVRDVLKVYDAPGLVKNVEVKDDAGRSLLSLTAKQILESQEKEKKSDPLSKT